MCLLLGRSLTWPELGACEERRLSLGNVGPGLAGWWVVCPCASGSHVFSSHQILGGGGRRLPVFQRSEALLKALAPMGPSVSGDAVLYRTLTTLARALAQYLLVFSRLPSHLHLPPEKERDTVKFVVMTLEVRGSLGTWRSVQREEAPPSENAELCAARRLRPVLPAVTAVTCHIRPLLCRAPSRPLLLHSPRSPCEVDNTALLVSASGQGSGGTLKSQVWDLGSRPGSPEHSMGSRQALTCESCFLDAKILF